MKRKLILGVVGVMALFVVGCQPESETKVTVAASALRKVVRGELAKAHVEIVFDRPVEVDGVTNSIMQLYRRDRLNRIRSAALPYLGEGAIVDIGLVSVSNEVEFADTIAQACSRMLAIEKGIEPEPLEPGLTEALVWQFDIPVGTRAAIENAQKSILWLEYTPSDQTFRLVRGDTNLVHSLCEAVGNAEFLHFYSGQFDSCLKLGKDSEDAEEWKTVSRRRIKILDDEIAVIGVAAVEVNGKAVISGPCSTGVGDLIISYDNEFYMGKSPCFVWGGFQTMYTNP